LALTIGALAVAWLAWVAAGRLVNAAGCGELDLPARACAVFCVLAIGEAALARIGRDS
jgi:hypothetical protein